MPNLPPSNPPESTMPPASVLITEEGPREGFQIEKGPIPTSRKVELIDALSETGLTRVQVASFVSLRQVPGMADADDIARRINIKPGVEYTALWFNDAGLERARASGRLTLEGKVRIYPSDAFLKRNINRTPAQHLAHTHAEIAHFKELGIPVRDASVSNAFGCNFQGDIPLARVIECVGQLLDLAREHDVQFEKISLADTMAWATPHTVKRMIGAIHETYPDAPLSLHLHDTRGMGIANAYAGLEMGISKFDAAVGGLGGCPFAAHKGAAGNVCTEDLVFLCQEMGIETGIDLDALIACAQLAEDIVGHPLPGSIKQGGNLARLRQSAREAALA
jgi:hydroxymethylglutaryl-CoA lyase